MSDAPTSGLWQRAPCRRHRRQIEPLPGALLVPYDPFAPDWSPTDGPPPPHGMNPWRVGLPILAEDLANVGEEPAALVEFASTWGLLVPGDAQPVTQFVEQAARFRALTLQATEREPERGLWSHWWGWQAVPCEGGLRWAFPTLLAAAECQLWCLLMAQKRPRRCATAGCPNVFVVLTVERNPRRFCDARCGGRSRMREWRRRGNGTEG